MVGRWNFLLKWSLLRGHVNFFVELYKSVNFHLNQSWASQIHPQNYSSWCLTKPIPLAFVEPQQKTTKHGKNMSKRPTWPDVFFSVFGWKMQRKTSWDSVSSPYSPWSHPWKWTWKLKITQLKRKIIFQTSIDGFPVNFSVCSSGGKTKKGEMSIHEQYCPDGRLLSAPLFNGTRVPPLWVSFRNNYDWGRGIVDGWICPRLVVKYINPKLNIGYQGILDIDITIYHISLYCTYACVNWCRISSTIFHLQDHSWDTFDFFSRFFWAPFAWLMGHVREGMDSW